MLNRFQTGNSLVSQSWNIVRNNKVLFMYPIVSMVGVFVVTVVFMILYAITGVFRGGSLEGGQSFGAFVVTFLFYIAQYTVINFSNAALISSTMKVMDGQPITLEEGYRAALERISDIIVFSIMGATVGMLSRAIRQSASNSKNIVLSIIGSILAGIVSAAWSIVSFFVLPIIMFEKLDAFKALSRSWELFKKTWGENAVAQFGLGCALFLGLAVAAIPGILLTVIGVGIIGIPLLFLLVCFFGLLSGAINGVLQTALYRYAVKGDAGSLLPVEELRAAYAVKAK